MNQTMDREDSFFPLARGKMVQGQLLPSGIRDSRLLEAMGAVEREKFVPPRHRSISYIDDELEIAKGRFLMEPRVLGKLLQEARLYPGMRALIVGCATGYSAAILNYVGLEVTALDSMESMCDQARENLQQQSGSLHVVCGPLAEGWGAKAPYDMILIEGGVMGGLEKLHAQLVHDGVLLSVWLSSTIGAGRAFADLRSRRTVSRRFLFDAWIPPLEDFLPPANQFHFS